MVLLKNQNYLILVLGLDFSSQNFLKDGYNLSTADKNPHMIIPFQKSLKELGHQSLTTISSWLDLSKHFKNESFDMLFNRGNTFIYATVVDGMRCQPQ